MNETSTFTFMQPWWFLLLVPAFLLLLLRRGRGADASVTFPAVDVLKSLGSTARRRPFHIALPLALAAFIAGVVAIARPVMERQIADRTASGIDIVIALDISLSMEINDFALPDGKALKRMDAAKAVIREFIERRPDDRMGLVVFSGRPYAVSPITLDHKWLLEGLKVADPNNVEEKGTAIGSAISAAALRLDARDAKSKIIVLVTDGANNSGKIAPIEAARYAKTLGIKIYTVAIGTEKGRVDQGIQRFPRQEFDIPTLQKIAADTGAEHFWAQNLKELSNTFTTINQLEKTEAKTSVSTIRKELYAWFAIPAAILALLAALATALNTPPSQRA